MSILSKYGRVQAASLVEKVVLSDGQEATLFRADPQKQLVGSVDASFSEIGKLPIELATTPSEEIKNSLDATACVLPGTDVRPEDRLQVNNDKYRVQTVKEERLFGIATHLVLALVKLDGQKR